MSFWDRFFMFIWSLTIALLSLLAIWVVCYPILLGPEKVKSVLQSFYADLPTRLTVAAICLLFLFFSLRFFWLSIRRRKRLLAGVSRETEIGSIYISLETVESLALKTAEKCKGVRDVTARVRLHSEEQSVGIGLKVTVDGVRPFPELSQELQQKVKEQVEEITGIAVVDVTIYIAQTIKTDRARVRVN